MTKPCLYLISISDSNRLLTLQGKPNHTTYEHPEGLIWQPFTSSPPKFPHCNVARGSVPLVSRAPARVFPDVAPGVVIRGEGCSSYVPSGAYKLHWLITP